jgi:uncharacterized protein (DUF433 family)
MSQEYVEQQEEGLYVAGSRVSLDSIVYAFLRGASPETIHSDWPTLSLEQVYGAVTYYLAHRESVDDYLRRSDHEHAEAVPPLSETAPALYEKLQRAGSGMAPRKR